MLRDAGYGLRVAGFKTRNPNPETRNNYQNLEQKK